MDAKFDTHRDINFDQSKNMLINGCLNILTLFAYTTIHNEKN